MDDATAEFLARVFRTVDEMRRREASGWLVVIQDTDPAASEEQMGLVSAHGPFDTPEEAVMVAAKYDSDPQTGTAPEDGEPGWRHFVIPLFEHIYDKGETHG